MSTPTQAPPQVKMRRDDEEFMEDVRAVQAWRESIDGKENNVFFETAIPNNKYSKSTAAQGDNNKLWPIQLASIEGEAIELSCEATRSWEEGATSTHMDPGDGKAANLKSVEVDDELFLSHAWRNEDDDADAAHNEEIAAVPETNASSQPIQPEADEEDRKGRSILAPQSNEASRETIDELDALVMAVEERQRSQTQSPLPGQRVWSPATMDRTISLSPSAKKRDSPISISSLARRVPPLSGSSSSEIPPRQKSRSPRHDSSSPSPLRALRETPNILESPSSGKSERNRLQDNTNDALSDVPSDIDPAVRERYILACRLLKTAIIQKEKALSEQERSFLQDLIGDDAAALERIPSESDIAAIETASDVLMSDPLFRGASFMESDASRATDHVVNRRGAQATKEMREEPAPFASFDGQDYPFRILGIDDVKPTVMTPSLLEALRGFLPYAVADDNFWLKFSLVRDGDTLGSLLQKVRASRHTILGVETKDGFVFGAFCSTPWRIQRTWFGTGESFLWRLKNSRYLSGKNNARTYDMDHQMEVYPYTGHDDLIQYCTPKTLAVGGGDWDHTENNPYRGEPTGIGFTLDGDLLGGETNACATFANPRLCGRSSKGSEFEIIALEVWTLTPCNSSEEAEHLEMRKLFVEENRTKS